MLMPETSMHKYRLLASTQHDVGISRKITGMKPVSVPKAVQGLAYGNFGPAIFLLISLHHRHDRSGACSR
jgi:hypothetical protein